ncbi:twin-arginine translocase TatA/TatE family subunit [Hyphobacterium sp.]|jgi:sec-independent protein translocase protein TatA|uniref:twin-arginine translocase TatA/TatE family subunit n=1 Tax=Hyphobacterium sp. TaxID=2004662 RepID=UPI00374785A4
MAPGIWQILIIVVLIALLFGAGRISGLMGEVAKGITSFRKGLKEGEDGTDESEGGNAAISEPAASEESATTSREEEKTRN